MSKYDLCRLIACNLWVTNKSVVDIFEAYGKIILSELKEWNSVKIPGIGYIKASTFKLSSSLNWAPAQVNIAARWYFILYKAAKDVLKAFRGTSS